MIGVIIAFILAVLCFMTAEAISIAAAGYVFLDTGFWDAWHAAWNRPGWLFLFAVLAATFQGSSD